MIQKEFIRNELRYRYPDLTDTIRQPRQSVGRPLLLEGGNRALGARIIVCTSAELDAYQGAAQSEPLFLCVGKPNAEKLHSYDICILPQKEQTSALLNFVQRLFDRLDDWTQSLRQAAEMGEGVETLLRRASRMLQNPVLLLDARGHIVAQDGVEEIASVIQQIKVDILNVQDGETGRVQKIGNIATPEQMMIRLVQGDARFTLLCLASERPFYASDEIVLESLAGFLRLMLSERALRLGQGRGSRTSEPAANLFRLLLLQEGIQKQSVEALHQLGYLESDEYAVLAVEPIHGVLRATETDAICDLLEDKLIDCCAFSLSPVVVAIVRTSVLKIDSLRTTAQELANENGLKIGICESFAGFSLFPERLQQANLALNHAEDFSCAAGFADVFEREFIPQFQNDAPKVLFCMRSVLALAKYDKEHETNYLETAECYVKNRFNAVRTAGELFIHRSTFLYRLERMKAQFGLDLDDKALSLLHILVSFQIAKEF